VDLSPPSGKYPRNRASFTSRAFPTLTIDLRAIFAELDEPENA
jgi:hypothetical protein